MDSEFIKRLSDSCDKAGIPSPNRGRFQVLSGHLGVSHTAVRGWFTGRSRPRYDRIEKLATLLEVDPMWLGFGREQGATSANVPPEFIHAGVASVTGLLIFNDWSVAAGSRDGEVLAVKAGRSRRIHPATTNTVDGQWHGVINASAWADDEVETPLVCRLISNRIFYFAMKPDHVKKPDVKKSGENVMLTLGGKWSKQLCSPTLSGKKLDEFIFA